MSQYKTIEGHKLLICPDPGGIRIVIIPDNPPLDEDVMDVFGLGINFSSLVRALKEMDLPEGFQGEGWDSSMRRVDGQINFQFSYKHAPKKKFETSLSKIDSQQLIKILEASVKGVPLQSPNETPFNVLPKVGRNEPCPCGSGKKYKKCCGSIASIGVLSKEFDIFGEVKDDFARTFLEAARQSPEVVADPIFWMEFGCALGSAEEYPLAIEAQMKALDMDPGNPSIRANYAATLTGFGRAEEALEILQELPNETGEFSVLLGNVLNALDRTNEAIPHYEKAIEYSPDFSFPYEKLLNILNTSDHPLYEYWLQRARNKFPQTPSFALAYAHRLIRENRLENLAEADWIDKLKHSPDPMVMGRRQEEPRLIVEIQVLQMIAQSLVSEDVAQLENAVKVLAAASKDWHLCVPAEQIAIVAQSFGRRDLVWQASRSFCRECSKGRLGPVTLLTFLAQSAQIAGDSEQALKDVELGLKEDPKKLALRNVYWWVLDDVGRSEEALVVAQSVRNEVTYPDLCYNIGYLAGKTGKPATAIKYYELELQQQSDHAFGCENLAFHRLLEGDLPAARQLVDQWQSIVSKTSDTPQIEDKLAKFERLATFAEENEGSISLSLDVIELNKALKPFFGAETKIPKARSTREDIVAALADTDSERKHEVTYAILMQERGDYSVVVARLEKELSLLRDLPHNAFLSITEGQLQLEATGRVDFAPCTMAFCKGLEISLYEGVFQAFRADALDFKSFDEMVEQASFTEFEKAASFTRFISKGAPLELGTMAFTLNLCRGKTAKKMELLGAFSDWIEGKGLGEIIEQGVANEIAHIAKSYRNPATHSLAFSKEDAQEAKRLCFHYLRKIVPQA
jgi:tetratricopeptide (TPR) repeat protein